ncbi:MAG TPA: hypothetical protein VGF67_09255 [Ktedonobacteraceae bacterium]|jgi:hypothetical protein
MIRIALDIDGTLGYRNRQQYLRTCNQTLQLALAEERLQDLSLHAFYQLPEMQAYKQRVGEAHYTKAVAWIDYHPDVLQAMRPLPGAKEGVARLATLGSIAYYTARYCAQSEERSRAMAEATVAWLAAYHFANPTNAIFCDGLPGKLWQLAQEAADNAEPVLLVDDQYSRLLQQLTEREREPVRLLQRFLILIAYGAQTAPERAPIPVIALPSWEKGAVHRMLEAVVRLLAREQEEQIPGVARD